MTKEIDGNARFLVDQKTVPPSLKVDIEAAISIPAIRTYGGVVIKVNAAGAKFEGDITFFDGIFGERSVNLEWDWKFTYFRGSFGNVIFVPKIMMMESLELDVANKDGVFELLFDIQISVLAFAKLGASLEVQERGDVLWVAFELVANLQLIETTVKGEAEIVLSDFRKSDFGSFDVTIAAGGAVEAVTEFVEASAQKVADAINDAIEKVGTAVKEIGAAIEKIAEKLVFISVAFIKFGEGIESLINGDLSAFAGSLVEAFDTFFQKAAWEDLGNAVLDGLVSIHQSSDLSGAVMCSH
jgi:hypothetical protein